MQTSHIQEHRLEIDEVKADGARMISLIGEDARSVFDQLEVVMCRWREIESHLDDPAPFIYAASRTTLREIPQE